MPAGLLQFAVVAHVTQLAEASWARAVEVAAHVAPLADTSWAPEV
jgi:hypothetical protein